MATINKGHFNSTPKSNRSNKKRQKIKVGYTSAGPGRAKGKNTNFAKSELQRYRTMLLAKFREVLGTVSGLENKISGPETNEMGPGDLVDMAAFNQAVEEDYGLLESERHVLDDIQDALERIKEGTYGLCRQCNKQIPGKRLQIIPWALYCVACESEMESSTSADNRNASRKGAARHTYRSLGISGKWLETNDVDVREDYQDLTKELTDDHAVC